MIRAFYLCKFLKTLSRITAVATHALSDSAFQNLGIVILFVIYSSISGEIPCDSFQMTIFQAILKSEV
jgi:hypothetical protein